MAFLTDSHSLGQASWHALAYNRNRSTGHHKGEPADRIILLITRDLASGPNEEKYLSIYCQYIFVILFMTSFILMAIQKKHFFITEAKLHTICLLCMCGGNDWDGDHDQATGTPHILHQELL